METLNAKEILDSDQPPYRKIKAFLEEGALTPKQRQEFCNRTADRVVRKYCLNCGMSVVEDWAERWLSGEDRTKSTAAYIIHICVQAQMAAAKKNIDLPLARGTYWAIEASVESIAGAIDLTHWYGIAAAEAKATLDSASCHQGESDPREVTAARVAEYEAQLADLREIMK